jgi:flagellar protein FlaG
MDSITTLKTVDVTQSVAKSRETSSQGAANPSAGGIPSVTGTSKASSVGATTGNGAGGTSGDAVKQLKESVDAANARLAAIKQRVDLSVDHDTGQVVVKISNTSTGEVISQVPSENALKLAKSLDSLTGILVDKKG